MAENIKKPVFTAKVQDSLALLLTIRIDNTRDIVIEVAGGTLTLSEAITLFAAEQKGFKPRNKRRKV